MKEVSRSQEREILSRFMTQVRWNKLDGSCLQEEVIQLPPEEFGRRFTAFLKNGCRFNFGDKKLFLTETFDLCMFPGLGSGWSVWRGPVDGNGKSGEKDIDSRSLNIVDVNVSEMIFETCLNDDESLIDGETKLFRLNAKKNFIRFGVNVFFGLWFDYQANKENSVLEFLYLSKKIQHLDFFGTILRNQNGAANKKSFALTLWPHY